MAVESTNTSKPRVLITGGAGFLGASLVAFLLNEGFYVIAIDNYWTGTPSSLERFSSNPAFEFVRADVTEPFSEAFRAAQIYHLACPASPKHFATDPLKILDTCYRGTTNALKAAREWNSRILLASTSEIYGDAEKCPQVESYYGNVNSFGPRSCYDEGKRVSEALAYAYRQQFGVDVRIARIFNVYGPGMHANDGRVINSFVGAAIRGHPIVVNGDGSATRCFQYIDDFISGLSALMQSQWQGGPINIGSEDEMTILDLAHIISEAVAKRTGQPRAMIQHATALKDDPLRRKPDCQLARKVLGWSPKTVLTEGLRRTIEWHLQALLSEDEKQDAEITANGVNGK